MASPVQARERAAVLDFPDPPQALRSAEMSVPAARPASSVEAPLDIPVLDDVSPVWRAFEIVVALIGLVLAAPIMLIIAVAIRLDSPGPALFRQHRLGVGARPFRFYKFRTMHVDARERFPELYAYRYSESELGELRFKVDSDPRVTRLGGWLRRVSLDELPNLLNVLTGDMALVGPRPEIPEMLPHYKGPRMLRKFTVRPGVTGLAQTSGRGRLKFLDTVALDVQYVDERSWRVDLAILARTVKMVLMRDGAF